MTGFPSKQVEREKKWEKNKEKIQKIERNDRKGKKTHKKGKIRIHNK